MVRNRLAYPSVLSCPKLRWRPSALAGVLEKFTSLLYSRQRTLVECWAAAKSQEARDKNLAQAIGAAS